MKICKIRLFPDDVTIKTKPKTPLGDAIKEAEILLNLPCGGEGRCGKCIVRVISSPPAPSVEDRKFLSDESIKDGLRLACRLVIEDDIEIEIPKSTMLAGVGAKWEEVSILRDRGEAAGEIILSLDLGTTNIAGAIVDKTTGEILAQASVTNPQAVFGADVISRINAVSKNPDDLKKLQKLVIESISDLTEKITHSIGLKNEDISGATLCGNPTMEHLFLGIDPVPIAYAPFTPRFTEAQKVKATDIGLPINPDAEVYVFPVLSGYVGGDTLAFVWSSRIHESEDIVLGIDVGTNGEIVLGKSGNLLACSAAAGPAFEGSHIKHGMRADVGAIEAVKISSGKTELSVKGDVAPRGICGSGLIDTVAQMLKEGIIDPKGRINGDAGSSRYSDRIKKVEGVMEFILYGNGAEAISITQKDIREVQLAKGAIRSGADILTEEMGIDPGDIKTVLIAGSFGNYLKAESIAKIGLVPKELKDRIRFVGDAALSGAVEAASDPNARRGIERLSEEIRYIELSSDKRFNDYFIRRLSFD
jgi:uncharacterized 2Fe-2S/4Fe-4S cluster protein (DUF4445 family)